MQETKRSVRRSHVLGLQKSVPDECRAGASVASVTMAHGLNANLVHKWRRLEQCKVVAVVKPQDWPPVSCYSGHRRAPRPVLLASSTN